MKKNDTALENYTSASIILSILSILLAAKRNSSIERDPKAAPTTELLNDVNSIPF